MLWDVIRKEILENVKSPKFPLTFLLCTILILLSVYTGVNNYRMELREYHTGIALNKKNLESQLNYNVLGDLGTNVIRSPQVLRSIITGVQEAVGRRAKINIYSYPSPVDSKYNSNPITAVFSELDLTLIAKIVLSLLAILFSFDAIVGEKERGTLRLIISNNVPRYLLILGKAIGSFVSLLLPFLIPLLMSLIVLIIYPDVSLSGEDWMRIVLIFVLFFIYLSVFFTLGLFVSTRTSHSQYSLIILLFIWVMFITIIPKAAVIMADQIEPVPSMYEITAQKDVFLQEMDIYRNKILREWRMKNSPPGNKGRQEYNKKFKKFNTDLNKDIAAKIEAKNTELDEEYQAKQRKQRMLAMDLSRISPASSLTFGAISLGRTGISEHERFASSIKTYKTIFIKWINAKDKKNGYRAKQDLSDMPLHEFKPENLRDSFARAIPDFVILILMSILFFTGAFVSFLRYDVR